MDLTGKIIQVLPAQQGVARNGNAWKVQPYVMETLDQYPRKVYFEVYGEERIQQNQCAVDDTVTISFDIESREFNFRWYTVVRAWRVAKEGADKQKGNVVRPDEAPTQQAPADDAESQTDLLF